MEWKRTVVFRGRRKARAAMFLFFGLKNKSYSIPAQESSKMVVTYYFRWVANTNRKTMKKEVCSIIPSPRELGLTLTRPTILSYIPFLFRSRPSPLAPSVPAVHPFDRETRALRPAPLVALARTGGGPLCCGRRKVRAPMFLFFRLKNN